MVDLIIINGLGGSGKSSFIELCWHYCEKEKVGIVRELSTVDYVKKIARLCGWDGSKSEHNRIFLSDLKKAFAKWDNTPIKTIFNEITNTIAKNPEEKNFFFFVNSREPEDIKQILSIEQEKGYRVATLKVERSGLKTNEVPELINDIINMKSDYFIKNNGTIDDLKSEAKDFINHLLLI